MSMFHLLSLIGSGGGGAAAFYPATLFVGGKAGVFYDTATLSSLFSDRSATPVTPAVVDGPVGTRKDLSGNGNHQIAPSDAARPILRTDGSGHYWLERDTSDDILTSGSLAAVGLTGAIFLGGSARNSGESILFNARPASFSFYLGDMVSGGGAYWAGQAVGFNAVDGAVVNPQTTGALFTAFASASGVTPRLFESRSSNIVPFGTAASVGFYGSGIPGPIKDYGFLCMPDVDVLSEQVNLREWFYARMGLSVAGTNFAVALGDSTVATFFEQQPVWTFVTGTKNVSGLAVPGETIAQQQARWVSYASKDRAPWVAIQVGLNDLDPSEAASLAIARLQALVTLVRADVPAPSKILIATLTPCRANLISFYGGVNGPIAYQKWLDINQAISNAGATPITGVDARITSHTAALNDGSGNLDAAYDIGDGVHENNAGRLIIGTAWQAALSGLGF